MQLLSKLRFSSFRKKIIFWLSCLAVFLIPKIFLIIWLSILTWWMWFQQRVVWTKLEIYTKEQRLICRSTFHRHSRVFNNENNPYPEMNVKRPLATTLNSRYTTTVPVQTNVDICWILFSGQWGVTAKRCVPHLYQIEKPLGSEQLH